VCAHAVRVALKSVPGVDSVEVSLNKGLASVQFNPSNKVTVKQLHDAIAKNGFTTKQTTLIAHGLLFSEPGSVKIRVTGSNEVYTLRGNLQDASALLDKNVELEGTIPEVPKNKTADSIEVKSIKAYQESK
jgi:copper chaperone CopZ